MNPPLRCAGDSFDSCARRGVRRRRSNAARAVKLVPMMLLALLGISLSAALADDDYYPYQQFVKYDNDSVSVAFSNMRAAEAAYLIRSTIGVTITLPSSTRSKTINLRLEGAKVDQAVRSLLTALELNNSFLVYDPDGRLTGVIALETAVSQPISESQPSEDDKNKTKHQEMTSTERDSLLRDFGRWSELTAEERDSIHARIQTIPPSEDRDQLIKEYIRQVLGVVDQRVASAN